MLGVRDSQPKYHQSEVNPAPGWRQGAVANRCLIQSGIKDGKAAYTFTDHLSAYSKRVLFVASAKNEVIGTAFQERQRQFFPAADLVTIPDCRPRRAVDAPGGDAGDHSRLPRGGAVMASAVA